jgi:hypothetical protein
MLILWLFFLPMQLITLCTYLLLTSQRIWFITDNDKSTQAIIFNDLFIIYPFRFFLVKNII